MSTPGLHRYAVTANLNIAGRNGQTISRHLPSFVVEATNIEQARGIARDIIGAAVTEPEHVAIGVDVAALDHVTPPPSLRAYTEYAEACDAENLEPLTTALWLIHGCPEGPLS